MTEHTNHRWAVDSIDEGIARIEEDGERMITIPRHLLPDGVTAGQLLRVSRSSPSGPESLVLTIEIDRAGAAKSLRTSKATMAQAMDESKTRDPGGDVAL
ncbi:MAG: DUF3006 domain-containing protein [bacterium]